MSHQYKSASTCSSRVAQIGSHFASTDMKYEAGEKPAFLQRMIAGEKSKERPTVIGKAERDEDAPELEDEAPLIVGPDGETQDLNARELSAFLIQLLPLTRWQTQQKQIAMVLPKTKAEAKSRRKTKAMKSRHRALVSLLAVAYPPNASKQTKAQKSSSEVLQQIKTATNRQRRRRKPRSLMPTSSAFSS